MSSSANNADLAALVGVYRLLARLWRREADLTLLKELDQSPMREALEALDFATPAVDQATCDELAGDYCQLFVGPKNHLPPCQSVWAAGQFQGEVTVAMRQWLQLTNYEIAPPLCPEDHLGVQLGVMEQLVNARATAPETDRADLEEMARQFFAAHLCWTEPLTNAVMRRANTSLYGSLARVTATFLVEERRVIE